MYQFVQAENWHEQKARSGRPAFSGLDLSTRAGPTSGQISEKNSEMSKMPLSAFALLPDFFVAHSKIEFLILIFLKKKRMLSFA